MRVKLIVAPVLLFFVLLAAGSTFAQIEIPRVTVQELKSMIDGGTGVVILDAQPKAVYEKGHIKGAISFPWKARITMQETAALPHNKPILTYCDCGPGESDSANLAAQLAELGFTNVKVLQDPSIRGWKQAGFPMD
jgi:rhodanese-related sulfurtransferase